MELYMSMRREKAKLSLLFGVITFGVIFFMAGLVMNTVYGAEIPHYAEVMKVTTNATNLTEGYLMDGIIKTFNDTNNYSGLGE